MKVRNLFWALHSAWALVSGVAVLVLAHNRYGFVRWVVLFIALTWGSTLLFSRFAGAEPSNVMRFAHGVVSYLTRVMYQETLFFLIPFYFYSSTLLSWNFLYVVILAALAVLSCFDMLFDRLLREHPWFAIAFFAFVSFSALQFFLPIFLRTHIQYSVYIAATIAVAGALALAPARPRVESIALAFVVALLGVWLFLPMLPPVPLRLTRLRFSGALDPATLRTARDFDKTIPAAELRRGRIYAVATIFSPDRIPASLQMRFVQNGKVVRAGRKLDLTATPEGFRIWDSVRLADSDTYRAEIWSGGQLLGKRVVRVSR